MEIEIFYDPSLNLHLARGWTLSQLMSGKVNTLHSKKYTVTVKKSMCASQIIDALRSQYTSEDISFDVPSASLYFLGSEIPAQTSLQQLNIPAGATLLLKATSSSPEFSVEKKLEGNCLVRSNMGSQTATVSKSSSGKELKVASSMSSKNNSTRAGTMKVSDQSVDRRLMANVAYFLYQKGKR